MGMEEMKYKESLMEEIEKRKIMDRKVEKMN